MHTLEEMVEPGMLLCRSVVVEKWLLGRRFVDVIVLSR